VLLDRPDRQAKDRSRAEDLGNFQESQLTDHSTRQSAWHGR
jgi:hypothetical protein